MFDLLSDWLLQQPSPPLPPPPLPSLPLPSPPPLTTTLLQVLGAQLLLLEAIKFMCLLRQEHLLQTRLEKLIFL